MTEAVPRKSDLGIRTLSAIVMLAIFALAAGWGGIWLDGLIGIVAILALGEFLRLAVRIWANPAPRFIAISIGALYIGLAAYALLNHERYAIIWAIGLVACADILAYFFGRTIGGPKIAPSISPSKTWAGLLGAVVGGALVGGVETYVYWSPGGFFDAYETGRYHLSFADLHPEQTIFGMTMGGLFGVIAQAGDFLESWFKRKAGVKDSSNLIPGHGGVLDRVDGLLAVSIATLLPISTLFFWLQDIGWIPE